MLQIRHIQAHARLAILELASFAQQKGLTEKRTLEKEGVSYVLRQLLNDVTVAALAYTGERKPFLQNRSEHISISHSHDKLVVMVDEQQNCGVDIELVRDKVLGIRHKYLSQMEQDLAGTNVELLITYWAAKETLYKIYGKKGLDFAKHLSVEHPSAGEFRGTVSFDGWNRTYQLKKEKLDNYILVYSLREV